MNSVQPAGIALPVYGADRVSIGILAGTDAVGETFQLPFGAPAALQEPVQHRILSPHRSLVDCSVALRLRPGEAHPLLFQPLAHLCGTSGWRMSAALARPGRPSASLELSLIPPNNRTERRKPACLRTYSAAFIALLQGRSPSLCLFLPPPIVLAHLHAASHCSKVPCITIPGIHPGRVSPMKPDQQLRGRDMATESCQHQRGSAIAGRGIRTCCPCRCPAASRPRFAAKQPLKDRKTAISSSPVKRATAVSPAGLPCSHGRGQQLHAAKVASAGCPVQSTGAVAVEGVCGKRVPSFKQRGAGQ